MTTQPDNTSSTRPTGTGSHAIATGPAGTREYLYFIGYDTGSRRGFVYLPLNFPIDTAADVTWVGAELRRQGLADAVVLSFALLPGGWGAS
jgi:hypothetical protein